MSHPKHSPTPWVLVDTDEDTFIEDNDGEDVGRFYDTSMSPAGVNAERIVACVNACAELDDPSKLPVLLDCIRQVANREHGADLTCKAFSHNLLAVIDIEGMSS